MDYNLLLWICMILYIIWNNHRHNRIKITFGKIGVFVTGAASHIEELTKTVEKLEEELDEYKASSTRTSKIRK